MACGYGRRRSQHEGDGSDEQRQPQQARYVHERPRACLNAPKRQAQAPECGCEPLHGPVRAVGGLLHAANRRMIGRSEAGIWEMSLEVGGKAWSASHTSPVGCPRLHCIPCCVTL
jgi:hypothetical protein